MAERSKALDSGLPACGNVSSSPAGREFKSHLRQFCCFYRGLEAVLAVQLVPGAWGVPGTPGPGSGIVCIGSPIGQGMAQPQHSVLWQEGSSMKQDTGAKTHYASVARQRRQGLCWTAALPLPSVVYCRLSLCGGRARISPLFDLVGELIRCFVAGCRVACSGVAGHT